MDHTHLFWVFDTVLKFVTGFYCRGFIVLGVRYGAEIRHRRCMVMTLKPGSGHCPEARAMNGIAL